MLLFPCLCRLTLQSGIHIRFSKEDTLLKYNQTTIFFLHFYVLMSRNSNCLHVTTAVYTDVAYIMFLIMSCRYVDVFVWCSKSVLFFVLPAQYENEQCHSAAVMNHQQIKIINRKPCLHTHYPYERWQLDRGV